jgi:Tol biopolymer transport system component
MKRLSLVCVAALLLTTLQTIGAQQTPADTEKLLARAHHKATLDGDLQGAIAEYRKIVAAAGANRALAAQALVRMAECYQKLGDTESRAIYERVVREYADQKDAVVVARAGLRHAQGTSVPTINDRLVWTGPKVDMFGQVSPDGRFITYVDWGGDQNLIVRDIVTNTDRPLTVTGPSIGFSQFAEFSTISRDGSQVAYAWYNEKGQYDLRILPLHAATGTEPRRFFASRDDIHRISPRDWSPDAKWIAVSIRRTDGSSQIGMVAVADGSLRVLKSVDWRGANKITFSPDGRFIAYDMPAGESDAERNVYVMSADASTESVVVRHPSRNVLMGWARDGHVLFASDRTGQPALWAQAVAAGKAHGAPIMIKRDIGDSWPLGLTTSGALYVFKGPSANYVQVTRANLAEGKVLPPAAGSFHQYIGSGGAPSWSPDGKHLSYTACGTAPGAGCTIAIASPETGRIREIRPKLSYLGAPRWSADGQSFLTDGTDLKGRRALHRIDAQTGDIEFLHDRLGAVPQWAPDEKKFYYRSGGSIIEHEPSTGAQREMFRERTKGNSISIKVSPDGRNIAAVEWTATAQTLYVIPVSGGAPIELLRTKPPEGLNGFTLQWTPDSRDVVLPKQLGSSLPLEFWRVPVNGAPPRKLDVNVENFTLAGTNGSLIHPDGQQIAFVAAAGKRGAEVWALENFLPTVR